MPAKKKKTKQRANQVGEERRKERAAQEEEERRKERAAQEEEKRRKERTAQKEKHVMTDSDGDTSMGGLSDDDEPPTNQNRRHKRPKVDEWAEQIIQDFVKTKGQDIKMEIHSTVPDFAKIEEAFEEVNQKIQKANEERGVSVERNIIDYKPYQTNYTSWLSQISQDWVKNNPEKGWKAYDGLYSVFSLKNREYGLPKDWNIPPDTTLEKFGDRPEDMKKPDTDNSDSAASFSSESESESEESDFEGSEGIDALESKMRKEYTALSHGKPLYWWKVGTGTQIFVRYGSKKKPIYRVRAGSSEPYDPKTTELVLTTTRGNRKTILKSGGYHQEVWAYSRNDMVDIIGVGWKVEDDDEANTNALALIWPDKNATYPHTRVLVKWKDGTLTLERRGFIRRIANGNSLNGDRMIYVKAKELENAYWGYDVEEHWDQGSDDNHYRSRKGDHFIESEQEESDADSETSQSSLDQAQKRRRSKRQNARKPKHSKRDVDIEVRVRDLTEQLDQLKVKQQKSSRRNGTHRRRQRKYG